MRVRGFFEGEGGGREVLRVGYPLMLSHASFTVQTFVDRLFLTWYSPEAMAGQVTGFFVSLAVVGLFVTTAEYTTTFVAQYLGAGRPERVGPAVWQGLVFALLASVLVALLGTLTGPFFALFGHAAALQASESTYSRILLTGSFPALLMAALSGFFAGRGKTLAILLANVLVTLIHIVLDWFWIFGRGGFPRAGVAGAAWSSVVAQGVGALLLLALFLSKRSRERFKTSTFSFEPDLFKRLLRFGVPSGLHFSSEVLAFGLFLAIVGRIGTLELAATGIAFNLNGIVFMPMFGLSLAVSSLVGRYQGASRPDVAERVVHTAFAMSLVYMLACGAVYLLLPHVLVAPYAAGADPATFAPVASLATVLLRFVAVYSIFDMMNVIFAGGLKGAGDTRYPLALVTSLGIAVMLVPSFLLCVVGRAGVLTAWVCASAFVASLGLLMWKRFRAGGWRALRVIETAGSVAA